MQESKYITLYYTIPRTVRELQPLLPPPCGRLNYTIPRTVRELQLSPCVCARYSHYTIPRTVRELQRLLSRARLMVIIPYQELLGNYNSDRSLNNFGNIIPYQELLGNYNRNAAMRARTALYHTRNCRASTKEAKLLQHTPFSKTKCVPFSALSLYFLRAHSQNGHTALYRLKFPKQ